MQEPESLSAFYHRVPSANPFGLPLNNAGAGHFNVYSRASCNLSTPYRRRDFFKVSLIIGTGKLHYADKWLAIDRPALLFSNPLVPYAWEAESELQEGWFCLFTEAFIQNGERKGFLQEAPLFRVGSDPVYFLDETQLATLTGLFNAMMREIDSDYAYKYNMLRSYLHLVVHEAMKMSPTAGYKQHSNAATRITTLFLELLERQFPIDTPDAALHLKTAADYANNLSVHVNHLNRAVKEVTGHTTTTHIATRIVREARALLQHTDWNVSEIAYSLGFEYPAYFNNFFKKNAGITPGELRQSAV
jgi:AraC-like DNA-binding protein